MVKKTKRDSRFELLRIIAMIMILFHHLIVHGVSKLDVKDMNVQGSYPFAMYKTLAMGGKVGVILFILITGYFQIESKYKFRKIFYLWLQVFFYSAGITIVLKILGYMSPDADIKSFFFPLLENKYGFFTDYFKLVILIPFLKIGLRAVEEEKHKYFIIIGIIMGFVIPTFLKQGVQNPFTSDLFRFITIFSIGAYFKLYGPKILIFDKKFIFMLVMALPVFALNIQQLLNEYKQIVVANSSVFLNFGYINLIIAVLIFLVFLGLPKFFINPINFISKSVFSVYLIHDHLLLRNIIWFDFFDMEKLVKYHSFDFLITATKIVLIIFVICTLIDLVRRLIFYIIMKIDDKFSSIYLKRKEG